jgi:transposase-like protein
MLDFPLDGLMDETACLAWLEKHLHPQGLKCPRCGATQRRVAKQGGHFPAFRCKTCDRYHTLLTDTAFAKTRQKPSTLVLLLRGLTKGESTSRLARELSMTRKQISTLRKRLQSNLFTCLPEDMMEGEAAFEADELYQNAGEKKQEARRPRCRPAAPARQQGQRAGHL